MSPVFEPPYADTVPPVLPRGDVRQSAATYRLLRHYGARPRGRSVLKTAGVYATVDYPTQAQIDAATEAYIGGHVYVVSDAVAAALGAAGYTVS